MILIRTEQEVDTLLEVLSSALKTRVRKGHTIPVQMTSPLFKDQPVDWDGETPDPLPVIRDIIEPGNVTFYI